MAPSNTAGPKIDLYIAMYPEGLMYKHWALFVDNRPDYTMFHVDGSEGQYRFDERKKDPRTSSRNPELIQVTTILQEDIPMLRQYARNQPLNRGHGWNCQDYVVELIEKAHEEQIITVTENKMVEIRGKIEGLA